MNQLIRKLAKKAGASECGDSVVPAMMDIEKFALLIVRECAKIADDGYGSDHFGNGIAGYQLLKHFGVEE